MGMTSQIYNNAVSHGFTKTQTDLDTKIADLMQNNYGCVSVMTDVYTYLSSFGYVENFVIFENKYWTWFGTRPKDR
jgi:hypothetical protein